MADIVSRFEQIAGRTPRSVALVEAADGGRELTYAQLDQRRLQIAGALLEQGVRPGQAIAIPESRSTEAIAAMLAVATTGATFVPLEPDLPEDRLQFLIEDAKIRLCLVADTDPPANVESLALDSLAGPPPKASAATAESPLYIMFTSGSTGRPKGVVVPHRAVHRLVVDSNFMPMDSDTRFLQLAPQSFDASTLEIWAPLLNGGTCILYPGKLPDPALLKQVISTHRVNALWLTCALFNEFVTHWPEALDGVETLLFGGERASVAHVRKAFHRYPGTRLINGYGPTENTTFTTCHRVTAADVADDSTQIPIGLPISGTRVRIVDPDGAEVATGDEGELVAGGAGLSLGYLNRPELTRERFFETDDGEHWYHTGDLVSQRADGVICYQGRMDRQLKVDGHRIEPGEIEAALLDATGLEIAHVQMVRAPAGGNKLVGYLVGEFCEDDVRQLLNQKLPRYMVPNLLIGLPSLPVNVNGKVDAGQLPNPFEAGVHVDVEELGALPLDHMLLAVWQAVIPGLGDCRSDQNFFDAGGSSMDLLGVKSLVDEVLGRSVPVVHFFEYPTIGRLADFLSQKSTTTVDRTATRNRADNRRERLRQLRKTARHRKAPGEQL